MIQKSKCCPIIHLVTVSIRDYLKRFQLFRAFEELEKRFWKAAITTKGRLPPPQAIQPVMSN
jgi:hypothetical protein